MVWWKKFALGALSFAAWVGGLIVLGGWGYASQYFWFSAAILAVAVSAAPFWRRRRSTWFWPSVALSIGANIVLMYVKRDFLSESKLPPKGIVEGMLIVDCSACWLLIVGVAYLTDHRFPWSGDGPDHS